MNVEKDVCIQEDNFISTICCIHKGIYQTKTKERKKNHKINRFSVNTIFFRVNKLRVNKIHFLPDFIFGLFVIFSVNLLQKCNKLPNFINEILSDACTSLLATVLLIYELVYSSGDKQVSSK